MNLKMDNRMKTMKYILAALLSAMALVSCNDWLTLGPIDYYGSESYWKTEANFDSYIDGMHKNMRDQAWTHTIMAGELRGGTHIDGTSSDGSSVSYADIITQTFDEDHTGLSNFGGYYGPITNVNLFIARLNATDVVPEAKKATYLGIAHGLRAFYYFDLFRLYGTVPLRLTADVVEGELDPLKLYMARSEAADVMAQIKEDLQKSLDYFGSANTIPYGKSYWSKAATEVLAGEVYLWSAKVATGNQSAGGAADIAKAKTYFTNVMNNYGLSLQGNFADVFSVTNKLNSEVIFAIHYGEGEATNALADYTYMSDGRGITMEQLDATGHRFGDPFGLNAAGIQRYQYLDNIFLSFDPNDTRRDATFKASYSKSVYEQTGNLEMVGTHVCKNIGYTNDAGVHQFIGDFMYYRLPLVYLSLAEIANYEGNGADVAKYVNLVRKRAYGSKWNEATYGYTAGSFTANELAILGEKDREFLQEGQRWHDLRRMTLTKDGKHLVFCPEANPKNNGRPILEESQSHKLLWPIDKTVMNSDKELKQTPGY